MRNATARGTATERQAPAGARLAHPGRGPVYRVLLTGTVAEARRLSAAPLARLRRGPVAFPLALGATGLVLLAWLAQFTQPGMRVVNWLGGESATLPLPIAVLRLPGSLFAPAPSLPVWGALAQVLVTFGLAEALVGRARTIIVAVGATAAATASGRLMRLLGPHSWVGLSHHASAVRDTGPSAAVVALLMYLCWVCRLPRAFVLVFGTMLAEIAIKPNLAGREHVVAIAVGVLAAALPRRRATTGGRAAEPAAPAAVVRAGRALGRAAMDWLVAGSPRLGWPCVGWSRRPGAGRSTRRPAGDAGGSMAVDAAAAVRSGRPVPPARSASGGPGASGSVGRPRGPRQAPHPSARSCSTRPVPLVRPTLGEEGGSGGG